MGTTFTINATMFTVLVIALCFAPGAYAFGAGTVPDVSAMSKIAYRHGTIENILETLAKTATRGGPDAARIIAGVAGAFFSGNAGSLTDLVSNAGSGPHFSGLDVKRVYFGNWLRDYSQAMDIAGLSKLSGDSILLVVMCLGFMAFGYATEEFEITTEKLGVYLCTEHIDNPKGYSSEAQQYDSRLRPPVDERELEIDSNNGMKKYIASENEGFDTSTQCIRQHLRKCIELGRQGGEKEMFEAYREMGTALHTLEDFLAHSNYLELALNKLGHRNVFCHVGDNVRVQAPNGQNVPPIITGTFGGSDFLVSVMGEVGDKLSSSTVNDLNSKFSDANAQNEQKGNGIELVKKLMSKIPSSGGANEQSVDSQLEDVENIRKNAVNIDPNKIASKEVQKIFVDVLRTRDSIFKNIEQTLEQLGLDDLIEELSNALSVLVLTTLEPYVAPIIKTVTEGLTAGSSAILQQEDQLVVFNDDSASDPTHSVLSKDHFDLWLNEPAGLVAIEIVKYTVPLIVQAWSDTSINPDSVIDIILKAIHHPYFARDEVEIQVRMLDTVRNWVEGMDSTKRNQIISSLTKESVKAGNNKREDSESYGTLGHRCSGPGHAHHAQGGGGTHSQTAYGIGGTGGSHQLATGNRLNSNPAQQHFGQQQDNNYGGGSGYSAGRTGYGQQHEQPHASNTGMGIAGGFDSMGQGIGSQMEDRHSGRQGGGYHASEASNRYEAPETTYGHQPSHGNQYGSTGAGDNELGRHQGNQYGQHGGRRTDEEERPSYQSSGFGGEAAGGYGDRREERPAETAYGRSDTVYGGAQQGHRRDNEHDNDSQQYGQSASGRHENRYDSSNDRGNRRDEDNLSEFPHRQQEGAFENSYGRAEHHGRQHDEERHGGADFEDASSRFGQMNLGGGAGEGGHGGGAPSYGRNEDNEPAYGGHGGRHHDGGGDDSAYGQPEQRRHGGRRDDDDNDNDNEARRFGGRGGEEQHGRSQYGESGGYGHRRDDAGLRGQGTKKDKKHGESSGSEDSDDDDKKKKKQKDKYKVKQDDNDKYKQKKDKYKPDSEDSDDDKKFNKKEKKDKKKGYKSDSDGGDDKKKKYRGKGY